MPKERLDIVLVERGLAESREQAQRLILAGEVMTGTERLTKPGHRVDSEIPLSVKTPPRFVSRGGDKLEAAFAAFPFDVQGRVCLDVGASTGGFTDCLLQHGASRVFAVDVGKGQLHWRLRQDARVTILDGKNARFLAPADLPESPSAAVIDVSFISLTKILPAVIQVLTPAAELITLIKPQFEAGRDQVGKGGVVRDPAVRRAVADRIRLWASETLAMEWVGACESPVHGPAGNIEWLAYWRKRPPAEHSS